MPYEQQRYGKHHTQQPETHAAPMDGLTAPLRRNRIVFFCIALLPIGWTVFALNHTSLHWFFTHRILSVFFAALTMAAAFPPGEKPLQTRHG